MLILHSSPASPFGRKVKIAMHHLGLADRIEVVMADTADPEDSLRGQNPLGKIPVLILEDGLALHDSPVILEYLDHLAGGGRIIPAGPGRFEVLRLQALADGIMDAAILQVYERRMRPPELRHEGWTTYQAGKVDRALAALEATLPAFSPALDVGTIALASALGYLDLRFPGSWRADHPRLEAWLAAFEAAVPSFDKTRPPAG
ncbi:MAG TPA: glutathione S-transferase [Hyphomicrobiales bacterium]|nr:glutathione S-transferase [Hyphomicrobiales bacterium]